MAWAPGVDGRSAEGLQSRPRVPMTVCGNCDARDGERIRRRELPRTRGVRVYGDVGSVAGRPSEREWNGAQSGQGTIELGIPGPALVKMQGEAACRAGDPSHQSEDPSPEGLGGHDLLTQADAGHPAGQVMRHHLNRQPGAVGGETPRRHVVQPDAVLEVAYRILDLGVAAMASLQFQHLPFAVGDEKVALGIEVEDRPFAKSTLQVCRAQLILHDKVREVFESSLRLARESGYLKRRGMRVALDTTNILGGGAVKDTYNLLADGIVKLMRALAAVAKIDVREWAEA